MTTLSRGERHGSDGCPVHVSGHVLDASGDCVWCGTTVTITESRVRRLVRRIVRRLP